MSEQIISFPELQEQLPCKNSMLLVDRVCVVNENKVIGLKAITYAWRVDCGSDRPGQRSCCLAAS